MNDNNTISVLHVASGDLWAGAEVQLFTMARALNNKQNIILNVVLFNHGMLEQKLLDCGIKVIVIDESKLNSIKIVLRLIYTINAIKPDLIHTHRIKENIIGGVSALITRTPSLRTVHGAPEHTIALFNIPKRILIFMDWFCGRYIQKRVVAVSADLAEILKKSFQPCNINVIENGIDVSSLVSATDHAGYDVGITDDKPVYKIGIAGRLVPVKRVDLFIKAAVYLFEKHPELSLSFHIFGDGPLRSELEALVQLNNASQAIHFEGHCNIIEQELGLMDILLITSDHEGLPMVLLEAMSLKIPVIAHAIGGIPVVLNQGESGVLISEQEASKYAKEILYLINNPDVRKEFGDRAFERVSRFYSSEQNACSYNKAYRSIV